MALTDVVVAGLAAAGVAAGVAGLPVDADGNTIPPADAAPFVTIWPDGPVRTARSLADASGEQTTVLVCHCAGFTPASAEFAEQKLADVVLGLYRAVIDGQTVGYPVQDWAHPMVRDDDVRPPLYDLAVEWRIRTRPNT